MSKVTSFTVSYCVSRSERYQSVKIEAGLEATIGEGEDLKAEMQKARRWLANQCNQAAEEELGRVLDCIRSDV